MSFVANSSSSSFIVICEDKDYQKITEYQGKSLIVDNSFGYHTFGWEAREWYRWNEKLIFAYIQASEEFTYVHENKQCVKKKLQVAKRIKMLEDVVKKHLGCSRIEWNLKDAYIDHQSSVSEGQNDQMFESKEALKDFIFNQSSKIHTDNDNY